LDFQKASEIALADKNCVLRVLPTNNYTMQHFYKKNATRATTRSKKADARFQARTQLTDLTGQISAVKGTLKELEQQKKDLKATTNVRLRRVGIAEKCKTIPDPVVDNEPDPLRLPERNMTITPSLFATSSAHLPSAHLPLDPELKPPRSMQGTH
jgi:hypothetical protein